jgi:hypothetical protein
MEIFKRMVGQTRCPYAKTAKVWYAPAWNTDASYYENVGFHATALRQFVPVAKAERYHGFVSEITIGPRAKDFDTVKRAFREYLHALASTDTNCQQCMMGVRGDKSWQFEYAGLRMFLNVFAPCYPAPHSKRVEAEDCFFVFFQPEHSFDLCGVNPQNRAAKTQIRSAFADADMPYNGAAIDARIEAELYMFPLNPTDPPVRWWLDDK